MEQRLADETETGYRDQRELQPNVENRGRINYRENECGPGERCESASVSAEHAGHRENAQHHECSIGTQGEIDECQVDEGGDQWNQCLADTSLREHQTKEHRHYGENQ